MNWEGFWPEMDSSADTISHFLFQVGLSISIPSLRLSFFPSQISLYVLVIVVSVAAAFCVFDFIDDLQKTQFINKPLVTPMHVTFLFLTKKKNK